MGRSRGSKKHKLGNVVSGFLTILDGFILIITLGNYHPNFVLNWNLHRLGTGVLHDGRKP
jgi:hypothetical protein